MAERYEGEVEPNTLLNLSPELRNHIYQYLLEGIQTSPGIIDYYQITTSERDEFGDLLRLLCICHQIRDELLSLLVKGQTLRLYLRHIPAFVESTMHSHFFGPDIPVETAFTIEIAINALPQSTTSMDADIAPFLKFVVRRPKIDLKFFVDQPHATAWQESTGRDLSYFLSPPHRDAWKAVLDTSIVRVELCEQALRTGYGGTLLLVLRHGSEKPSMQSLGITEQNMEESDPFSWRDRACAFVRVVTEDEPFPKSPGRQTKDIRSYISARMAFMR